MVVQRSRTVNGEIAAVDALEAWVREGGADLMKVEVREISPGHRGLFATEDLQPMTPFLRIPPTCLISSSSVRRVSHVAGVLQAVEADSVQDRMPDAIGDSAALLLFLMAELAKGSESVWVPWFRSMPPRFLSPLVMDFEEVEDVLAGTTLLPLTETLRSELREMYDDWFMPYAVRRHPDIYPEEICSYNVFLYAHAITESRAFKIDDVTMLVPFADMANHQPNESPLRTAKARGWMLARSPTDNEDASAPAQPPQNDRGLELYVNERAVRKGEELCISYGALPNWQLLLHYGFAIPSNPEETVVISLEVPDDDSQQLYMMKMLFLNTDLLTDLEVDHALKVDDPLPLSLLASTRLLLLNEEESASVSINTSDFSKPISPRNEKAAISQLKSLVQSMVSGFDVFEGSEGNDDRSNTFTGFCGVYVQGQLEILNKAMERVQAMELSSTISS